FDRGSAVDVALIAPARDGLEQRPAVVTLFAAGEAGGTEPTEVIAGDTADDETMETRDRGRWIIDAA
ncbi:MAG: hypothetical protein WCJ18_08625, partial [Planctomycetota bacterium]